MPPESNWLWHRAQDESCSCKLRRRQPTVTNPRSVSGRKQDPTRQKLRCSCRSLIRILARCLGGSGRSKLVGVGGICLPSHATWRNSDSGAGAGVVLAYRFKLTGGASRFLHSKLKRG